MLSVGDLKIAKVLLSRGADPNGRPELGQARTALYEAASWGHVEHVKMLLMIPGIEVDAGDSENPPESPLDIALCNTWGAVNSDDQESIVRSLIQAGADVWGVNDGGLARYHPKLAMMVRQQMQKEMAHDRKIYNDRMRFFSGQGI